MTIISYVELHNRLDFFNEVQPIYFNDCMINCFFNQKSLYMLKRTEIQNKLGFFLL